MNVDPQLAAQYGETFAKAHAAHYEAKAVIQAFSERHPFTYPVTHRLHREGHTLSCLDCGESVHAPSPPKRPLTPGEASLSRFD